MTLNISLVSPKVVYQSGDFKLIDVRTGLARPYVAQKSIVLQKLGWTVLIAFSGIGSVGPIEVADWLAAVTGALPFDAPLDNLLEELKTADTWLQKVPTTVDRRHTFSIVGFEDTQPVMALVSNWQALDAADRAAVGSHFRSTRSRPRGTQLFLSGSGGTSVSNRNRARLIGSVRSGKSTEQVFELFAAVNEEVSRSNDTVSAGCFVASATSTGSGAGRAFAVPDGEKYVPRFALPPEIERLLQPKLNPDGTAQPIRLVQMATQRSGNTEAFHREQLRSKPNDAAVWNNYGAFLLDVQHDPLGAEKAFRKALELDSNEPNAEGNLANVLKDRGELDAAEELYRHALVANPVNTLVRRNYAVFLSLNRNDPKAAAKLYREGLKLDPGNDTLTKGLEEVPTRKSYIKAIEDDPDNPDSHNSYGVFLECSENDPEGAEAAYRRALELDPDHVNASGNLAIRLWRIGDLDAAEKLLKRALASDPSNILQRNNLAEFLFDGRMDPGGAREVYLAGLKIDPTSRTLQEGMARLAASTS